jgi:hypothetical protein
MNVGRADKEAYTWFVNTYLRKVVPRNVQSSLFKSVPSKVFTISDEAIVLWFMENSWHVWEDMKSKPQQEKSLVNPRYTVPGDRSGGDKGTAGWTMEGKDRYNELFDLIEEERNSQVGKEFDEYYALSKKPDDFKRTKEKPSSVGLPVVARNTLSALCAGATGSDYNIFDENQEMDALDVAQTMQI